MLASLQKVNGIDRMLDYVNRTFPQDQRFVLVYFHNFMYVINRFHHDEWVRFSSYYPSIEGL